MTTHQTGQIRRRFALGRLGTKLTFMFLLIALLPLLGYGGWSLNTLRQVTLRQAEDNLETIIKMISLLCEAQSAIERLRGGGEEVDAETAATKRWQEGDKFLTLRELIRNVKVGKTGYCYVLDSAGTFHIHPELENKNIFELGTEVPELVEIRDLAVGMAPGEVDTLRYPWPDKDGNIGTKVAKFGYFEGYKWVVVAAAFEHEILAPFYTDLKFLVAFLSLTLVGVTFLAILIARVLIRPVLQLTKATAAIARNDYTVKLPVTTRDEIGQMAHSFGVMVNNLRDARNGLMEWSRTLEQKVAERTMALEKAQESMIMSEKMASLGKLSAMVAHEINNPLSGVLSYLKLTIKLLGRSDPPPTDAEKINQYLDLSAGEVKRCGEIVRNLLMFSKQTFGEFKNDGLNSIIDKSIALIKHSADMKSVKVSRQTDAGTDDRLYCDVSGIQQMFIALMTNALDAMEKGGELVIRADYRDSDQITIQVADTGKGIPEEILPRIFEPFFSFKESKKSIGMGLSVVYGIVQTHHGTINVESTVNVGTTFTIVVPRAQPAAGEKQQQETAAPSA